MTRAILFALAFALWAVPVTADEYEDAQLAYERGDYGTAARLMRILAEQGHSDAQAALGFMYQSGRGVPQDYTEAVIWNRKAAERGNSSAQINLGAMYASGQGVTKDNTEAANWYRKAAEQGEAVAQITLGTMYFMGNGVPEDFVLAHMWFNLAAARGDGEATKLRDAVAAMMTRQQIAEAQRLARKWEPK